MAMQHSTRPGISVECEDVLGMLSLLESTTKAVEVTFGQELLQVRFERRP